MPLDNLYEKRKKALEAGYTPQQIMRFEQQILQRDNKNPSSDFGKVNSDWMADIGKKIVNSLPGAGAAIGGTIGGLGGGLGGTLAGPLGTVGGGIAGAGIGGGLGYSGGRILQESLQDLFGTQDEAPLEKVKSTVKGSAYAGAGSAAGQAGGELLGAVARPVGKKIFEIGAHVPKSINKKLLTKAAGGGISAIDDFIKLSDEMLEKGAVGRPQNWIKTGIKGKENVWNLVTSMADDSAKVLDSDDIFRKVSEKIVSPELGESIGRPGSNKALYKKMNQIMDEWSYGKDLTLKDIVDINKVANNKLWSNAGTKGAVEGAEDAAWNQIDKIIKATIREQNPELADALAQYGIYDNIEKVGIDVAANSGRLPTSIQRLLDTILANSVIDTTLGRGLYNAGNAFPGLGAGTGGALAPYLTNNN